MTPEKADWDRVRRSRTAAKMLYAMGLPVNREWISRMAPYVGRFRRFSLEGDACEAAIRDGVRPTREEVERRTLLAVEDRLDLGTASVEDVQQFIETYRIEHGQGPTWSEVGKAWGWTRPQTRKNLLGLVRCGLVSFTRQERSLQAGMQVRDEAMLTTELRRESFAARRRREHGDAVVAEHRDRFDAMVEERLAAAGLPSIRQWSDPAAGWAYLVEQGLAEPTEGVDRLTGLSDDEFKVVVVRDLRGVKPEPLLRAPEVAGRWREAVRAVQERLADTPTGQDAMIEPLGKTRSRASYARNEAVATVRSLVMNRDGGRDRRWAVIEQARTDLLREIDADAPAPASAPGDLDSATATGTTAQDAPRDMA